MLARDPVDIRRLVKVAAEAAGIGPSHVIGKDEEEIRPLRLFTGRKNVPESTGGQGQSQPEILFPCCCSIHWSPFLFVD